MKEKLHEKTKTKAKQEQKQQEEQHSSEGHAGLKGGRPTAKWQSCSKRHAHEAVGWRTDGRTGDGKRDSGTVGQQANGTKFLGEQTAANSHANCARKKLRKRQNERNFMRSMSR